MKKVGILFLHGMGESGTGYANKLIDRIKKQVSGEVITYSVGYDKSMVTEQELLKTVYSGSSFNLSYMSIRNFMLTYVGDVGAMTNKNNRYAYEQTHLLIRQGLRTLESLLDDDEEIIVVAHSLGCEVFSNYLWDAGVNTSKKNYHVGKVSTFVTLGCNIPIFNAGLPHVSMFKKPSKDFSWLNYYSKYDVLGYPLKPLGADYSELVEDIDFNVGGWLTQYTPLCHMHYWNDRGFAKELGNVVEGKFS